jgi:hypothetical protein
MSTIDLQLFCANERDIRSFLWVPFSRGGYVYATNGHLAVRVPADGYTGYCVDSEPGRHPKTIERPFDEAFAGTIDFQSLHTLPAMVDCNFCNGTGVIDDSDEGPNDCVFCGGSGKDHNAQLVGNAHYALHYLHLLNKLPGLRIAPRGVSTMAALTFDGGQALLMPVRV